MEKKIKEVLFTSNMGYFTPAIMPTTQLISRVLS